MHKIKSYYVLGIIEIFMSLFVIGFFNYQFVNPAYATDKSPWPMFAHDPQHTGQSNHRGPHLASLKWKFDSKMLIFTCPTPPIGADNTIYISVGIGGNNDGNIILALNPDGTEKWRVNIPNFRNRGSAAVGPDGTIYVGCNYRVGYLYAIRPDGATKWIFNIDKDAEVYSPIIGQDGTIYVTAHCRYFGYGEHNLYAINQDGQMKWKFPLTFNNYTAMAAISPSGDTIYVTDDYSYDRFGILYAINSANGEEKWRFSPNPNNGCSSPSVALDGTIYVSSGGCLYAIKPDGLMKWKYAGGPSADPVVGLDGTVYVGGGNYLYSINSDGTLKWQFSGSKNTSQQYYNSPGYIPCIGSDGTIYARSITSGTSGYHNVLYGITSDGNEIFNFETGGQSGDYSSGLSIGGDGTLYFVGIDGVLYAFNSPEIGVDPTFLINSCQQGKNAPTQSFGVWNSGSGMLSYTISITGTDVSWLNLTPTQGNSTGNPDLITITYNNSALPEGTYNALITVADPSASNNPQTIPVTLTVTQDPTIETWRKVLGPWLPVEEQSFGPIASDPYNPNVIYLGSSGYGIYKTDIGKAPWFQVNNGLPKLNLSEAYFPISGIFVNPNNPSTIYCSTATPYDPDGDTPFAKGIYKSTDCGNSWTQSNGASPYTLPAGIASISKLVGNPHNPYTLYTGHHLGGIYKTIDGGAMWDQRMDGLPNDPMFGLRISALAIDPLKTNILYAAPYINDTLSIVPRGIVPEGLYKTVDGGANWSLLNTGMVPFQQCLITAIGINPTDSNIIFFGTFSFGIYLSTDGGNTWMEANGTNNKLLTELDGYCKVNCLMFDKQSPITTYAGLRNGGIYKSEDNGRNWLPFNDGLNPDIEVRNLLFVASQLYATTSQGVFKRYIQRINKKICPIINLLLED